MISKTRYNFIIFNSTGMGLDAIWFYISQDAQSYDDRKALFLWVLKKMLEEKKILLAKQGHLLTWSIEETLSNFQIAFPQDDENLNNGVWFFTDECPAGIGWRMPGGFIDWN